MSPTSCQLLHPAMFYYSILTLIRFVNCFSIFSPILYIFSHLGFSFRTKLSYIYKFQQLLPSLKINPRFQLQPFLSLHFLNHIFPSNYCLPPAIHHLSHTFSVINPTSFSTIPCFPLSFAHFDS